MILKREGREGILGIPARASIADAIARSTTKAYMISIMKS
jgi:hypothetical protein